MSEAVTVSSWLARITALPSSSVRFGLDGRGSGAGLGVLVAGGFVRSGAATAEPGEGGAAAVRPNAV
jgi:hypothetical protein